MPLRVLRQRNSTYKLDLFHAPFWPKCHSVNSEIKLSLEQNLILMTHLEQDYLDFFRELEQNNSKAWFDENRKRYENSVKKPFKKLVIELCKNLQILYPSVDLTERFSIMRINRDIRFSADKTPYKIHMGATIMPSGSKDKSRPGFYVQANHNDVRVYSGSFGLEKDSLYNLRDHIHQNLDRFAKLVNDPEFKDVFGEILGDKNKRLPPEFKDSMAKQPLIANKNFYWFFKLNPELLTQDDLIKVLILKYEKTLPLNAFFEEVLGNK